MVFNKDIFGRIGRIALQNSVYFLVVGWVYMKNPILSILALIFMAATLIMESHYWIEDGRRDEEILEFLLALDRQLRLGASPGWSWRVAMEGNRDVPEDWYLISDYGWILKETLEREIDFDYQVFHKTLKMMISERRWKKRAQNITRRSRFQCMIMKHLPLVIEWIMISQLSVSTMMYSISLVLLYMSNFIAARLLIWAW
jgi:hypothetical protein